MKKPILKSCVLFSLMFNFSMANAVAPRITQDMFGQEVNADIVAYESIEPSDNRANEIAVEIVKQAFAVEEITLNIDVVPSKQLAIYALFNGEVSGLIGKQSDLTAFDKTLYFNSVFYVHYDANKKIPVALYIDKKADNAEKRFSSFKQGLLKIIENQTYSEIIKKQSGKIEFINYMELLKQYNEGG